MYEFGVMSPIEDILLVNVFVAVTSSFEGVQVGVRVGVMTPIGVLLSVNVQIGVTSPIEEVGVGVTTPIEVILPVNEHLPDAIS